MLEWDSPVLILGETGSGKGVLARWLHANGPRREEAFVNLNCAGLSRELLESELFGHERGAFTGAVNPKQGLLEVGHRGHRVPRRDRRHGPGDPAEAPEGARGEDLPPSRRRAGPRTSTSGSSRSTNLDLEEAVRARKFRDDLYYRVSTLTLKIPPLRERTEDIPLLARNILRAVCTRMGKPEVVLGPEAESQLLRYPWPGNIRELANVLERAMILLKGDRLESLDVSLDGARPAPTQDGELATMKEMERLHIERVLQHTGGNVAEAAAVLGMARRTLYDRLKALGLAPAGD